MSVDKNPSRLPLSEMALRVFTDLYTFSDETIIDAMKRVSKEFGNEQDNELAFNLMKNNIWRPSTPVWFSAGSQKKIFAACWVTDLQDSMDSIYDTANVARKIFQSGAGIGIPIGKLREKDGSIYEGQNRENSTPQGKSSGPISFMQLFDAVGATTKSGGRARRAAIMMVMPVSHPDIMEYIECKAIDGVLSNMNISVSVTDAFMRAFKDNIPYQLVSPSNGVVREINARVIWDKLIDMAHKTADPGILFIDTINKFNPLKKLVKIECTNPCGEQPLIPYTSCNLSSINLHKFCTSAGEFDMEGLYETAYTVAKLMDSLIDNMDFPDERFKVNVLKYRPIGVGIMGLSDTLYELGLVYDSKEGQTFAESCMKTVTTACIEASSDLAKEKGCFANYKEVRDDVIEIISSYIDNDEVLAKVRKNGLRNCQHTTIAPTGSIALSCDCSYGMEPCFGLVFQKTLVESGDTYTLVNPIFKRKYENEPWYSSDLIEKIVQNGGSLKGIRGVPKEVRDVFVVAHDIKAKDRIDMQSVLQKHVSTAISSTINLANTATRDEVSELYRYAYSKGLKGVTIYRDGSKKSQPITFSNKEKTEVASNFTRPSKLQANVHVIETGNGKMYVTVSTQNGRPVEMFMSMGKSGQVLNNFCEALGRTISIALQHGVPIDAIIKTLEGINSDRPAWFRFEETDKKPSQILSIPDAISQLLKRYYIEDDKKNDEIINTGELCSKCGRYSVVMIEGCSTCTACGESRCG